MVQLIGVSVVDRAKKELPYYVLRFKTLNCRHKIIAQPGPSFTHKDRTKNLQYLLAGGSLKKRGDLNLIVWHEALNNSLTKHKSNNYIGLQPSEPLDLLKRFADTFSAIVK